MPAQVVVVLDNAETAALLARTLRANGHGVQPFSDPMLALDALERAQHVELLITCLRFAPGRPTGRSIALMTRYKRPDIKLILLCHAEEEEFAADLGRCLGLPVDVPKVAAAAEQLLAGAAQPHPAPTGPRRF